MKEKPILFSTPMVKAILEGRKTMTRRVIKPQPDKDDPCIAYSSVEGFETSPEQADEIWAQTEEGQSVQLKPKYKPGDILWVRETWQGIDDGYNSPYFVYKADGKCEYENEPLFRWRPSIHMPREAARLFLEVKSVRVEQLQDITEADAKSEGLESDGDESAVIWFSMLWDRLNTKRVDAEKKPVYSWESNPWVWVIEFRRVK